MLSRLETLPSLKQEKLHGSAKHWNRGAIGVEGMDLA